MAVKQSGGQRHRAHKVSKGTGVGARKTHLTIIQKALIVPNFFRAAQAGRADRSSR